MLVRCFLHSAILNKPLKAADSKPILPTCALRIGLSGRVSSQWIWIEDAPYKLEEPCQDSKLLRSARQDD